LEAQTTVSSFLFYEDEQVPDKT